jgi:hypothetical protein
MEQSKHAGHIALLVDVPAAKWGSFLVSSEDPMHVPTLVCRRFLRRFRQTSTFDQLPSPQRLLTTEALSYRQRQRRWSAIDMEFTHMQLQFSTLLYVD